MIQDKVFSTNAAHLSISHPSYPLVMLVCHAACFDNDNEYS